MNPILCAIDVPSLDEARALLRQVSPFIGGMKLGLEFFIANGPQAVGALQQEFPQLKTMLDLKFKDIPETVAKTVAAAVKNGHMRAPDLMTLHCDGGSKMLKCAADIITRDAPATTLLGVTVLTSMDDVEMNELGLAGDISARVARYAALGMAAGLGGLVCSPQEVASLRAAHPAAIFVIPGIRPSGSNVDDQKRIATPEAALAAGASYLVIGRPITKPDGITAAESAASIARSIGLSV